MAHLKLKSTANTDLVLDIVYVKADQLEYQLEMLQSLEMIPGLAFEFLQNIVEKKCPIPAVTCQRQWHIYLWVW